MNRSKYKIAAYKKHEPVKPQPMMRWKCLCGNENRIIEINCCKCGKQHWIQLGFTREMAQDISYWLTPAELRRVA